MKYSEKLIRDCQEYAKEKLNQIISEETAEQYLDSYARLYEWFADAARQQQEWQRQLKKNPRGFHLSGDTYNCFICGDSISGDTSWHDKCGHSCIPCRNARRKGIIPAIAYKNRESWYTMSEFETNWGVKNPTIRQFIKDGKLKTRVVRSLKGRPHFYLFMIRDNKDFLPSKPKSFHIPMGDGRYRVEHEKVESPFEGSS
jgi:hypothetical protein